MIKEITQIEEFESLKNNITPFVIFKHSNRCNISTDAYDVIADFTPKQNIPFYLVNVIDSRPLSNFIEQDSGLTHKSPQILIYKNSNLVANQSHWNITEEFLLENIKDV
jgi:bacillithiol system protein YtxJ